MKSFSYLQAKGAFTLIEIVVSATILVILTSIGFYSYTKNISDARDSSRVTALSALESELSLYKRERGAYPFPGSYFNLTNGASEVVALQGKMDKNVALSTANSLPMDPELKTPYLYGTTSNRQEFQLAATMENSDNPYTYLVGKYKSVANTILPNILIASDSTSNVDISVSPGRDLFLFHKGYHNLPYDFDSGSPYSDGTLFADLMIDAADSFWQNSDYRSCEEITTAAKRITPDGGTDDYQILTSTGFLDTISCDCTSTGCTES